MDTPLQSLDPRGVLAAAETNLVARRDVEAERLLIALSWCDLHSDDPSQRPVTGPRWGGDYVVRIGGDGTPTVQDLCFAELAIAFQAGVISTRNLAADALDLRHRLPALFDAVLAGRCEVWLARRVATMSRQLPADAVSLVDSAVTAALRQAPGRVLEIAEAAVIEADPLTHQARVEADGHRTGVWLFRARPGTAPDASDAEPATRRLAARLPLATALELDATLDDLADALTTHTAAPEDHFTRDQLRAQALDLLTRPHDAVALLDGLTEPEQPENFEQPAGKPQRRRRPAVLHVHISSAALTEITETGIARVEGVGPMLLGQAAELLARRDLTLQPVLDLNTTHAVHGYEHPVAMRERAWQRTAGDVFPHSTSRTRHLDYDHIKPYEPDRRGQTSDLNTAPLARHHHRAKTHTGMRADTLALGVYRWITPHGLTRVVTPRGTQPVELIRTRDGTPMGEMYRE